MPHTHTPLARFIEKLNDTFNQWVEQEPRLTKFVQTVVVPSKERSEKLKQYALKAFQGKVLSLNKVQLKLNENLHLLKKHKNGAGDKCIESLDAIFKILEKKTDKFEKLITLTSSYLNGPQLARHLENRHQEHDAVKKATNDLKEYCDGIYSILKSKIPRDDHKLFNIIDSQIESFIKLYKKLDEKIDNVFELTIRDFIEMFDGEYQYILYDLNPLNNLSKEIVIQPTMNAPTNPHQLLKKLKQDIKFEMQKPSFAFSPLELHAIDFYLRKIDALITFLTTTQDLSEIKNLALLASEWAEISVLLFANKGKINDPKFLYVVGTIYSHLSYCFINIFKTSGKILHPEELFFADCFVATSEALFKKALSHDKTIEQSLLFNLCLRAKLSLMSADVETFEELTNKILETKKRFPICKDYIDDAVYTTLFCAIKVSMSGMPQYNVALFFLEQLQLMEKSSFSSKKLNLETEINQVREKLTTESDALLNAFSSEFKDLIIKKISFSYDFKGYHIFLPISLAAQRVHAISDIFPKVVIKVSEKRTDCSYFSSQIAIEHLLVTDIFASEKFSGIRFMLTTLSSIDAILKEVKFLLETPLVTSESVLSSKLAALACKEKNAIPLSINIKENLESAKNITYEPSPMALALSPVVSSASIVNHVSTPVPAFKSNEHIQRSYALSKNIHNNNNVQSPPFLDIQQVSSPLANMAYQKNINQKKTKNEKINNNNCISNNKNSAEPLLLNISTANKETKTLYGNDFGFKFSGEVTPIYSSEFTQKKRSTCFFVRWKGIKGLDINREAEFEKLLNPHPDGVITVGPLNEEGLKLYSTSLLRAKLLKKGLACKTVTAAVEETTKDNKVLFGLGDMKKHKSS